MRWRSFTCRWDDVSGRWCRGARFEAVAIPLAALAMSLAIFGVFILCAGHNPFEVFGLMYKGAYGTSFAWATR